jgi:hypothetical protein
MRSSRVISTLVGWALLAGAGCGGGEFASQGASGGTVGGGDGGVSATGGAGASNGGASSAGHPSGGAPLGSGGGSDRESGGNPSGGISSGGVVSDTGGVQTGGTLTGGAPLGSGGVPSGGAPTGGNVVVAGGTSIGGVHTGGIATNTGGKPSGGASTGGNVVVAGGTSIGGVPTGGIATNIGGKPSGGTSSGGATSGGVWTSTGGTSSGGAPTGGAGGVVGRGGSGGSGCNCPKGLTCCPTTTGTTNCLDLSNDINNCGKCGSPCAGSYNFCDNGTCGTAPCNNGMACISEQTCCNASCCSAGQLCCRVAAQLIRIDCFQPVNGTCPPGNYDVVCASPDTSIATPDGPRPIASLREGDHVYSVDRGRVVSVPVLRTRRMAVSSRHTVVRATLASGAVLEISAPHPTADGRRFEDLRAGDQLGGLGVAKVEVVPYGHAFTYDILPASDSGTYFAEGALVGSTLHEPADLELSLAAP